jgi:predicted dehydrogenase
MACLEAGKAVLCEKPFALNAGETGQIVDQARRSRRFCMEAMWMRFHPLILKVRSMLQTGEIGTVRMLTADFGYPTPQDARGRFFDLEAGGGALLDRGVYPISLAYFLLGPPADITGRASIGQGGVDEQDAIVFTYSTGALAMLAASLRSRLRNEAVIIGTRGQIRIHEPFYAPHHLSVRHLDEQAAPAYSDRITPGGWKLRFKRHPLVRRALDTFGRPLLDSLQGTSREVHYVAGQGYQFEAEEVMRRLRAGELESPLMPLEESLAIARTTDHLRKSWGLRYPSEAD